MALTTLGVAASIDGLDMKVIDAAQEYPNAARFTAFSATAGTGNYPAAGLTLDLSKICPTKVLAVTVNFLYNPTIQAGSVAYPAVYVPAANGDPATGKIHLFRQSAATNGLLTPVDDNAVITGFVISGFAIGY